MLSEDRLDRVSARQAKSAAPAHFAYPNLLRDFGLASKDLIFNDFFKSIFAGLHKNSPVFDLSLSFRAMNSEIVALGLNLAATNVLRLILAPAARPANKVGLLAH